MNQIMDQTKAFLMLIVPWAAFFMFLFGDWPQGKMNPIKDQTNTFLMLTVPWAAFLMFLFEDWPQSKK